MGHVCGPGQWWVTSLGVRSICWQLQFRATSAQVVDIRVTIAFVNLCVGEENITGKKASLDESSYDLV